MSIWDRPHTMPSRHRARSNAPRIKRANPEHKLQVELIDYLEEQALKFSFFHFAIPNQSNRHVNNAVRMKAEGVRAGVADICIMLPKGKACFIEMKAPGGSLSKAQQRFRNHCYSLGHGWALCRSKDEAIPFLKAWGAIR